MCNLHEISFNLQSLAQFHALCIAIRRLQPNTFNEKKIIKADNLFPDDNDARLIDVNDFF